SGHFAATWRVTDMDRVFQVKRFNQGCEIVGVGIHFIAVPRLAGSAMAAAIVRDAAVAAVGQEQHLVFKRVRAQWPAMTEDYRLSFAPVLVIDLRAIFCRDRAYKISPVRRLNRRGVVNERVIRM